MITVSVANALSVLVSDASAASGSADMVRGAIGGAFVIATAFLAGFAVFRRSSSAITGLLMVLAAAALEFTWLGLFGTQSVKVTTMLQGVFGASILVYVSSVIGAAKRNALLGGLVLAAALTFIGLGILNLFGGNDAPALMRYGLMGVGGFVALLSVSQAIGGDHGARLLLPGVALALAAPIVGDLTDPAAISLTPHALFTLGVLAASLVAVTENFGPSQAVAAGFAEPDPAIFAQAPEPSPEAAPVSENQLAQILDYSGIAVWDWSEGDLNQSDSFGALLGADPVIRVTPTRFRELVHPEDRTRFEYDVFNGQSGDGAFDTSLKLRDGSLVRLRGARAVDEHGMVERLVVFAESSSAPAPDLLDASVAPYAAPVPAPEKPAPVALASSPAAATSHVQANVAARFDEGKFKAAFQPIVSLDDQAITGYEALLRSVDSSSEFRGMSTEEIVLEAEKQGKGAALATMMLDAAATYLAEKLTERKQKNIFVAFNVSFAQIRSSGFVGKVADVIKERNFPSKSLVLELTESEAISDDATAKTLFSELRDAGAGLAFDDFGAGFSSLGNLQKFSFDYLKVDKSFTERLIDDPDAEKIVSAIARLGGDLGMTVIAEGLASKELAERAKKIGCKYGQGFAFGDAETAPSRKKQEATKAPLTLQKADEVSLSASKTTSSALSPEVNADEADKKSRRRFWSSDLR